MAETVRNIMTPDPIAMPATTLLNKVSQVMRDSDVGAVVVLDLDRLCGIVTDRDIVVRAIASGKDPSRAVLGDICSREVVTLAPSDTVDKAEQLMKEKAVRRIPVVEDGRLIGMVSLGDLAQACDSNSVLGQVSAARANK